MADIVFKVKNKTGHIILNRPEKINSLTHEMILNMDEKLKEWEEDASISFIILYGAGTRGFCSGGNMTVYYDNKERAAEIAKEFFPSEYNLDLRIINYPKPIIVFLDGIVMGGGVGISYGAKYRLVTEATKWAMPEVNIGFFPDVGGSFFLNQIPQEMAKFISLTAKVLSADDVLYLAYAEEKIDQERIGKMIDELTQIDSEKVEKNIENIIEKYKIEVKESYLEKNKEKIKHYFTGDSMGEIIEKLKRGIESGDDWASEISNTMKKKSLLSQHIIIEQLKRSKKMTIKECFDQEIIMSLNFMNNPDFYEGVRSVLVDKDKANWKYKELDDISEELVKSYFN